MTNFQLSKNYQVNVPQEKEVYDLEERFARFAEKFILLVKKLPLNSINRPLVEQGVAAVGSAGANYCEATEAESRKDFSHKIGISKKEVKESKHWIRLLACANPEFKEEFRELWKEAQELLLILSKISQSSRSKN